MAIIGKIRKHSAITVTFIALALIAFIIGDVFKKQQTGPGTNIAQINDSNIPQALFDNKVFELEENYKRQTEKTQVSNAELYMIREQVWNNLLEERLYTKEYNALGLSVGDAELNDMFTGEFIHPALEQIPAFLDESGKYDRTRVSEIIANFEGLNDEGKKSIKQMEEYTRENRLTEKYNTLITKGFYTPTALGKIVSEFQAKTADVRCVSVGYETIPDNEVVVTNDDYKKYYDLHKNSFKLENTREIDYIIFNIEPTAADLEEIHKDVFETYTEFHSLSSHEIPVFVNSKSDVRYDSLFKATGSFEEPLDSLIGKTSAGSFVEPMIIGNSWMMAKVLKIEYRPDSLRASSLLILNKNASESIFRSNEEAKILADSLLKVAQSNPEQFQQLVMQYSDDPQKEELGGDLNWKLDGEYGFFNEKLIQHKLNDCFILERPDGLGYHIVRVTGKTAERRKAQVALITREIEPSNATVNTVLTAANAFEAKCANITEMKQNAQKENLSVRSADNITDVSNRLPGLENAREIVRWAFDKKTKVGQLAPEIYSIDGVFVLAALNDIHKKGYASLEQKKLSQEFQFQVKNEKRAEMLLEKAKKIVATTKDINAIAQQFNTTVDTVTAVGFGEYSFGRYGAELSVLGHIPSAKTNSLVEPIKGYRGVYVLYVDNVSEQTPKDPKMCAQELGMMNFQKSRMIIQVLKDNAVIKDNRALFF